MYEAAGGNVGVCRLRGSRNMGEIKLDSDIKPSLARGGPVSPEKGATRTLIHISDTTE